MSYKTIKEVMSAYGSHLKVDNDLVKRLAVFENDFVNYNDDHINFFGGNLLGTYPISFRQQDFNTWWDYVVEIDDVGLQTELWTVPTVNKKHKVGPNAFNISCVWLTHKIKTSSLSSSQKDYGQLLVFLIYQYKMLGSILSQFFPYPTDEAIAREVYLRMSRKFGLKQSGSWKKFLIERAQEALKPTALHAKTYTTFSDDKAVQYVNTDNWTRLKSIIKEMTDLFTEVRRSESRVVSTNPLTTIDGEKKLLDMINNEASYIQTVKDKLVDRSSFIRQEMIDVTLDINKIPTSEKHFKVCLEYMVSEYKGHNKKTIDTFIDNILLHAVRHIRENPESIPNRNDLANVIAKLRGLHTASKTSDKSILTVREEGIKIVRRATRISNQNYIAALRIALVIYVILVAFASRE